MASPNSKLALSFLVAATTCASEQQQQQRQLADVPVPSLPSTADPQNKLQRRGQQTSGIDSLAMVAAAASYASSPATPTTAVPAKGPSTSWSSRSTGLSAELANAADLHILAMGGSGPHVCPECSSGFAQKLRLLHHLHKVHGVAEYGNKKIIACDRCDSAFLRNTDLKKHLACVHEKRRPHACTYKDCQSRFFFAKDLKKHISTVHERNKPYACPKCGQKFGKREHMTSHVRRVHEKLKPFRCRVCKVPLASKYNLQGHLKTYSHKQRVAAMGTAGIQNLPSPTPKVASTPVTTTTTTTTTSTTNTATTSESSTKQDWWKLVKKQVHHTVTASNQVRRENKTHRSQIVRRPRHETWIAPD